MTMLCLHLALRRGAGLCLAVACAAACRAEPPSSSPPAAAPASRPALSITGQVVDATPDYAQLDFDKLASAKSEDDLRQFFAALTRERPAAQATVRLRARKTTQETTADADGKFTFRDLQLHQSYDVSAEWPSPLYTGDQARLATATVHIDELAGSRTVTLRLRADGIVIRGRLTDPNGQPVVGAKVRGEPYPVPETNEATPPTRHAVSDAAGYYELRDLGPPQHIHKIAGYLNGGDPTEGGQYSFYTEVLVEAGSHVQPLNRVPRIPLVTADVLVPARRYLQALAQAEATLRPDGRRNIKGEQPNLPLPASHGNIITGIDIVLDPAPASASLTGRLIDTKGQPRPQRVLVFTATKSGPGVDYVSSQKSVTVATGDDGAFALPSLAPGHYSVQLAGAPPQPWSFYQVPVENGALRVEPGQRVPDLKLVINPPEDFAISGFVHDARGNPVKGYYVSTAIPSGFPWQASTDDTGAYRLVGLDGTGLTSFRVSFGNSGLSITDIPLHATGVNLVIPDRGRIAGVVRNAKTGAAVEPEQISVPSVRLPDSGAVWEKPDIRLEQQPDGHFTLSNIPAGEATIVVRATGLGTQRFESQVAADKTSNVECKLQGPAVLEGRTTLDGQPKGTTIVIADQWLHSNADGTFRFDQFANGEYAVWFPGGDYSNGNGWSYRSATVTLKSGETTRLDMELGGTAEIRGTFTFPDDDDNYALRLATQPAPHGWSAGSPSADDGVVAFAAVPKSGDEYRLRSLAPGRYHLLVGRQLPAFQHHYQLVRSKTIDVQASETLALDLDLTKPQ